MASISNSATTTTRAQQQQQEQLRPIQSQQEEQQPQQSQQSQRTSRQKHILLLNGPNLNLLGTREPAIYGSTTLPQIVSSLVNTHAQRLNLQVTHFQSNHEGALIDCIHAAAGHGTDANSNPDYSFDPSDPVDAIILNPAAFTHYSVALRDALLGVGIPFVEVHLTNVHARAASGHGEAFRERSFFSDKAKAVIVGMGAWGYVAALEFWAWELGGGREKGI